ncbi:hypothetical protein [Priestia megaterium]|uniref:hypothetical protein n=1 Tax=Priestia megaterium TaxID=1404 RepID=UPI001BE6301F|nr:hypothetical protein [Priestia megaterium]MBT2254802.1 hypothetical protein [Priestia megaterium]
MKGTSKETDKVVRVIQCRNGGKVKILNNDINIDLVARFFLGLPQIADNKTEEKTAQ